MTEHGPNILETINISKCLGELQSQGNVSLKLKRGSFHALFSDQQHALTNPASEYPQAVRSQLMRKIHGCHSPT